ncbi:MAG: retroviral-like aspartic protease family protein [Rubrivivax sp.]|nr:retroviral-like aspartic protease family protein [Rubrivivax sp.]
MSELPRWLKHATVWLLLATGLFLAVQAGLRRADATRVVVSGSRVELHRKADGHYHWPGSVGDRPVEFLVDTGATSTAIPAALARELGLERVGRVTTSTAGGTVQADVVVGDVTLEGGVRAERLRMAALPGLDSPLLGMDVLGRLQLQQSGGVMRVDLATSRAQTP